MTPEGDLAPALASRRVALSLVAAVGLAGSALMYLVGARFDLRERQLEFDRQARDRFGVLQARLEAEVDAVHSLRAFFTASAPVTRQAFGVFAGELRERHPEITALEWLPRILDGDRRSFEATRRAEGLEGFAIRESGPDGELVPATRRPEYFPVDFVVPRSGNEPAQGFDIASDPLRREGIERARSSGRVACSAEIPLVQDPQRAPGFLLLAPVYRGEHLEGLVLGAFRVTDVLAAALGELDVRPLDVAIAAPDPDPRWPVLAGSEQALVVGGRWRREHTLRVADRRWLMVVTARAGTAVTRASWTPPLLLAFGLALTTLCVWLIDTRDRALAGRQREALHREFGHRIVAAQEEEREALARELHDGIGQDLAAMSLTVQVERTRQAGSAPHWLDRLCADLGRGVAELRRLSYGLHPLELEERGLLGAVGELIARVRPAAPNTTIHYDDGLAGRPELDASQCLAVYRTIQESISNALRHARAGNVWVKLEHDGSILSVAVEDDGRGFEPGRRFTGIGLRSMRERASNMGAELKVDSGAAGTRVTLRVPSSVTEMATPARPSG